MKIKKLSSRATVPVYSTAGAACFDLFAVEPTVVPAGGRASISTGLAFEVPQGYVMLVFSRSGHGKNAGVTLANSVGVVDSDYRGPAVCVLQNNGDLGFWVGEGDRIAQALILPIPKVSFEVVDELTPTARGESGFGSTGV